MPSLAGLVAYLSQNVSAALVAAGTVSYALAITDASATTPVVIATTGTAWRVGQRVDLVIAGVGGNDAANGTRLGVAVDDTHLALYTVYPSTGGLVPVAPSSAYTGGGTAQVALRDGRILIGRAHVEEMSSPPRIVFVPIGDGFTAKDTSSSSTVQTLAERRAQDASRSLVTDETRFRVHVWGQATPADPEGGDFDTTRELYQQVIRSTHLIIAGSYKLSDGVWPQANPGRPTAGAAGVEFVFGLSIYTPIPDDALQYAPNTVHPAFTYNPSS